LQQFSLWIFDFAVRLSLGSVKKCRVIKGFMTLLIGDNCSS
ncbi:unnamed protein product, partial [Prunus brigantina]